MIKRTSIDMGENERLEAQCQAASERRFLLAHLDRQGWKWDGAVSTMLDRLDAMAISTST